MFEEFWNGILELMAKFVIPDWGAVVGMLPVLILVLAVVVLAVTLWRLVRAPDARRGKSRITPRTPKGLHMPGPSFAPILASVGAFLLFLGIVFGGALLAVGGIALAVTLLYWLGEALRLYDHDVEPSTAGAVAVIHDGPPPGVHMPGPSFRPFLGAVGASLLMLGLVFGEWLLAVGVIALVATLLGWLIDARKEYSKTVEADSTGHLENIPPPRTPGRLLVGLGALLLAGFVVQAGWIPPRSPADGGATASGAPSGGPPPAPGGSGEPAPSGPTADVTVHAKNVAFLEAAITAPAGKPFTLAFVNEDPSIQHNVAIHEGSATGPEVFKGEIFPGVETRVYDVPAIPAGTYAFVCTVHPNMTGTATLQ
ncbi:MAG TPA: cytochrome c oxidase subunit 4 [Candidatus Limnocylindrales bacterium]|nr:cytochrome c oxidase subunit 4 [Candidatus Limnocylindrales bacterium]